MAKIVALPKYQRQAGKLLGSLETAAMENHIASAPEAHPVIKGTGGVRKARWRREGTGKSGGVRAIYFYYSADATVFMLSLYAKNQKSDLTEADKNNMRMIVDRIKERRMV